MIGEDVVEEDKDLNKRNINEINGGDVFKAHFKKLKRNEQILMMIQRMAVEHINRYNLP